MGGSNTFYNKGFFQMRVDLIILGRLNHHAGTTAVTFRDNKRDMSADYVRYQALRFLFIDEFSTASIEILAEINDKTSKHIRKDCI